VSSFVNGDIRLLRNVGIHVPHYMTSRSIQPDIYNKNVSPDLENLLCGLTLKSLDRLWVWNAGSGA
jgi:hypothetical protein